MRSLRKKSLVCLMIIAVAISAASCGGKKEEPKEAESQNTEETVKEETVQEETVKEEAAQAEVPQEENAQADAENGSFKIDYKTSELYTKEDMDAAIAEIMKEFDSWEGCEMHEISYTDDQTCKDNISYANELDQDKKGYADCIVFTSSFHSPKEGGGSWEADYEYEGWQWYLARVKDGSWELLTWGY